MLPIIMPAEIIALIYFEVAFPFSPVIKFCEYIYIYILKAATGIENTRKRPIWHARSTKLANPVWTFLPSGSPLSAMKSPIHRENPYDVIYALLISIRF
jgi:hypothetical protein